VNDEHERVEAIIREYGGKRDSLISILQDIQSKYTAARSYAEAGSQAVGTPADIGLWHSHFF